MASLAVFGDEIERLVVEEQKSRRDIYRYLVAKYGEQHGLSHTSVKRYCRAKGLDTPHPNTPLRAKLKATRLKVEAGESSGMTRGVCYQPQASGLELSTALGMTSYQEHLNTKFEEFIKDPKQVNPLSSQMENDGKTEHDYFGNTNTGNATEELITDLDHVEVSFQNPLSHIRSIQSLPQQVDITEQNQQQQTEQSQSHAMSHGQRLGTDDMAEILITDIKSQVQDTNITNGESTSTTPVSIQKVQVVIQEESDDTKSTNNLSRTQSSTAQGIPPLPVSLSASTARPFSLSASTSAAGSASTSRTIPTKQLGPSLKNLKFAVGSKVPIHSRKRKPPLIVMNQRPQETMTEYQRQKLRRMDAQNKQMEAQNKQMEIQNDLMKNLCSELQILRSGLFAAYDIKVTGMEK